MTENTKTGDNMPNISPLLISLPPHMQDGEITCLLAAETERRLDNHLLSHCDFLHSQYSEFKKIIEDDKNAFLPTSIEYAFKSIALYRATYLALQKANGLRKKMDLAEKILQQSKQK